MNHVSHQICRLTKTVIPCSLANIAKNAHNMDKIKLPEDEYVLLEPMTRKKMFFINEFLKYFGKAR